MKKLAVMAGYGLLMILGVAGESVPRIMPTQADIDKANPLVQEVMKAEMDALRSGKKTREQVADAAVALAKETQAPAEKYLLLTGAFDQYIRGGSYEKAHSTLTTLRIVIPDWKLSDEFSLIDKALRTLASSKGGPVRERYDALKERQQYAQRLKKALAQSKAKPADKKLQFQVATYSAALGYWPRAVDAFLAANNPACAGAAKLEKESAPPAKIADAWWAAADIKPDFLSQAIRAHAVDFYKKALADTTFTGLQKVVAERRIKEVMADTYVESQSLIQHLTPIESAKFIGVRLIGSTVTLENNILTGFSSGSYALIEPPIPVDKVPVEVVVEFSTPSDMRPTFGIMGEQGQGFGFSPFCINDLKVTGCFSSNGKSWDIAQGYDSGVILTPNETYRLKCVWDGSAYTWYVWRNKWVAQKTLKSKKAIANGLRLQLGTNRGLNHPFNGSIDLTKCYIKAGGRLWWEGVKGAYVKANQ